MYRATEKQKLVKAVKSKLRASRHFKVNPVLKIDETVFKQAESMWAGYIDEIFDFDYFRVRTSVHMWFIPNRSINIY